MKVLSAAAALLLLRGAASQECPSEYASSMPLDDEGTIVLKYAIVGEMLCAEMTSENPGWLGFGINSQPQMDGGHAVIGSPNDGTVQKYNLNGSSPRIELMDDESQTLMYTDISQDDAGMTTMKFAIPLVEEGRPAILTAGKNTFLYARGSSNTLGYHAVRSPFSLDFEGMVADVTPSPTPAGTGDEGVDSGMAKTIAPTAAATREPVTDPPVVPTPTPPTPPSGASVKSMIGTMVLGAGAVAVWFGM